MTAFFHRSAWGSFHRGEGLRPFQDYQCDNIRKNTHKTCIGKNQKCLREPNLFLAKDQINIGLIVMRYLTDAQSTGHSLASRISTSSEAGHIGSSDVRN